MLYVDIGSSGGINPLFIEEAKGSKFIACDPLDHDSFKSLKNIKERGGVCTIHRGKLNLG